MTGYDLRTSGVGRDHSANRATTATRVSMFLNWPWPHLIIYFRSFQTQITIFTIIYVKNDHPVSDAGIRTHYLLYTILLP